MLIELLTVEFFIRVNNLELYPIISKSEHKIQPWEFLSGKLTKIFWNYFSRSASSAKPQILTSGVEILFAKKKKLLLELPSEMEHDLDV